MELFGWPLLIIVGVLLLVLVGAFLVISKALFKKQLELLGRVTDNRARTIYLEHIPLVYARLEKEIASVRAEIAARVMEHNKDILFLLQEDARIDQLLGGQISQETLRQAKVSREDQKTRIVELLLNQLREERLKKEGIEEKYDELYGGKD